MDRLAFLLFFGILLSIPNNMSYAEDLGVVVKVQILQFRGDTGYDVSDHNNIRCCVGTGNSCTGHCAPAFHLCFKYPGSCESDVFMSALPISRTEPVSGNTVRNIFDPVILFASNYSRLSGLQMVVSDSQDGHLLQLLNQVVSLVYDPLGPSYTEPNSWTTSYIEDTQVHSRVDIQYKIYRELSPLAPALNGREKRAVITIPTDMDECSQVPDVCQGYGTCTNTVGSFNCTCWAGFVPPICNDRNECLSPTICGNGTCINTPGSFHCYCNKGYTGRHCHHQLTCATYPCQNGATCTDDSGSVCMCIPGFTGNLCEININECHSNPCQYGGTCTDLVNGYICNCTAGYTGKSCEININECHSNPCQHGGTCTDLVNTYTCHCLAGYNGRMCEIEVDECHSNPCQHGGICTDTVNAFVCQCEVGFSGKTCQTNIDDCNPNPCQHRGTCTDLVNGFKCNCHLGFTGSMCQTNIDDCLYKKCENGATCIDLVNGYSCDCVAGYTGLMCQTDINDCQSNPCQHGGTCTYVVNDFTCHCPAGYSGRKCELNINDCLSYPCQHGGTCTDLVNYYMCYCQEGYTGRRCDTDIGFHTKITFDKTTVTPFDTSRLHVFSTTSRTKEVSDTHGLPTLGTHLTSTTPSSVVNPTNEISTTPTSSVNPTIDMPTTPTLCVNPTIYISTTPSSFINPTIDISTTPTSSVNPTIDMPTTPTSFVNPTIDISTTPTSLVNPIDEISTTQTKWSPDVGSSSATARVKDTARITTSLDGSIMSTQPSKDTDSLTQPTVPNTADTIKPQHISTNTRIATIRSNITTYSSPGWVTKEMTYATINTDVTVSKDTTSLFHSVSPTNQSFPSTGLLTNRSTLLSNFTSPTSNTKISSTSGGRVQLSFWGKINATFTNHTVEAVKELLKRYLCKSSNNVLVDNVKFGQEKGHNISTLVAKVWCSGRQITTEDVTRTIQSLSQEELSALFPLPLHVVHSLPPTTTPASIHVDSDRSHSNWQLALGTSLGVALFLCIVGSIAAVTITKKSVPPNNSVTLRRSIKPFEGDECLERTEAVRESPHQMETVSNTYPSKPCQTVVESDLVVTSIE